MSSKFLALIVSSLLISCTFCAPVSKQKREVQSVQPENCNNPASSSEVNCNHAAARPSDQKISCSALYLFQEAQHSCHNVQEKNEKIRNCCTPSINTTIDISDDSIMTNFAGHEYREGKELELFGEEICAEEFAKSQTNNPNSFAECSAVLGKVRATVDFIRQWLFSNKCGCGGKLSDGTECTFDPKARLPEERVNRGCSVRNFLQWAGEFGYKISTIMHNKVGSQTSAALCSHYKRHPISTCNNQVVNLRDRYIRRL